MADRRTFLRLCAAAGFAPAVGEGLWNRLEAEVWSDLPAGPVGQRRVRVTREMVKAAEAMAGVTYTDAERDLMLGTLDTNLASYELFRAVDLPNHVPPAVQFSAVLPGARLPAPARATPLRRPQAATRPAAAGDLAFLTTLELGDLIRSRQVTSMDLTRLYLDRLRRYDRTLHCVVTLTEERALRAAAEADRSIAAGRYLGPLHGIPYGAKDLLAVAGSPTTWGAEMYRNRVLDQTATVVERLDAAGAVLVAKLATGELALNQTWFGGRTMNPWRTSQGAGGSSGGVAAAVAAGLVGFGIGTETLGSIVTPSTRNGVTGLRPTFGRVSRHGAMTLCWSLDKVGPIARSVEDCAVVLETIAGPDQRDPTVVDLPCAWDQDRPLSAVRVGYFKSAFDAPRPGKARDDAALETLRRLGARPVQVELPTDLPIPALRIVLVEAAAAFDELTRTRGIDRLAEQHEGGWPNFFRSGRFIPAVEYIQANRIRTLLMERMEAIFREVDVFVAPTFGVILVTNLTGHPCAVLPSGFTDDGMPASISFVGRLFGESELCTVARAWQEATPWHRRRPMGYAE